MGHFGLAKVLLLKIVKSDAQNNIPTSVYFFPEAFFFIGVQRQMIGVRREHQNREKRNELKGKKD